MRTSSNVVGSNSHCRAWTCRLFTRELIKRRCKMSAKRKKAWRVRRFGRPVLYDYSLNVIEMLLIELEQLDAFRDSLQERIGETWGRDAMDAHMIEHRCVELFTQYMREHGKWVEPRAWETE